MPSSYRDSQGYVRIYEPDNPCADSRGYVYEHRRKIAEQLREEDPNNPALNILGCLKRDFYVHHKNEDKGDNADTNLALQKDNGHKRHHFTVSNPHPTERDSSGRFV